MRHFKTQLRNALTGKALSAVGGKVYVTAAGGTAKATLYNADGSALANPITPSNGKIEFYTADAVTSVDLYGMAASGHGFISKAVVSSGDASLLVNASTINTVLVIPFNVADQTADATETTTGFALPGAVQGNVAVEVVAVDSTETIDVGTLSSASGDADGFLAAAALTTAGYIKGSLTNGAATLGALLRVQDSANSGDLVPEQSSASIGKTVTYTLTAGSDTASGFIILPVLLKPSAL